MAKNDFSTMWHSVVESTVGLDALLNDGRIDDPDRTVDVTNQQHGSRQFLREFYKDVMHGKPPNLLKTMISSPKVLSVMDRLKISDNQGVMMIGAVGVYVAEVTILRSTYYIKTRITTIPSY
jgi:hypothetical protein